MAAAAIPLLLKAAPSILSGVMGIFGSDSAGKKLAAANNTALQGVLGAAGNGMAGVSTAAGQGMNANVDALEAAKHDLASAGVNATANVNDATGAANQILGGALDRSVEQINPYLQAGQQGLGGLSDLMARPDFKFNYDDYKNDPAFDFLMKQGSKAITNSGSARGLGASGAIMQDLSEFGTGLAATHYGDAFNRAKATYDTNINTDLAGLDRLLGAGTTGLGAFNTVQGQTAGQQAANTIGAGKYAGDAQLSIADLLSKAGIDISKTNANLGLEAALANSKTGLQAAGMAGDYNVAGAGGDVAGGIGSRAALGGTLGSLADLIGNLTKKKAGGINV